MRELELETQAKAWLYNLTISHTLHQSADMAQNDFYFNVFTDVLNRKQDDLLQLMFDGREEDPQFMCHVVAELFLLNPKTQSQHEAFWAQIDGYYKAKLESDLEHESLTKSDTKAKEFSKEFTEEEKEAGFTNSLHGLSNDQI